MPFELGGVRGYFSRENAICIIVVFEKGGVWGGEYSYLTKVGLELGITKEISIENEVPSSLVTRNLNEWGAGEPKKWKASKISSLNHFTISGDARKSNLSKFSSFKSGEKVVYYIGNSSSLNL